MQLPILNMPQHLSPSSFSEFELCQYKFFLKRMAGFEWPKGTQTIAAAVGSAFDAFIKNRIAEELGLGSDPQYDLTKLLEGSVEEQHRASATEYGRTIFKEYIRVGRLTRLMNEGLTSIELSDKQTVAVGEQAVPVYGKPDAALSDGTIVDWKVQGAASARGASPTPGYCEGVAGFKTLGSHARAGEPLEQINPKWAEQLTVYSWLYTGISPFRPIRVAIENITIRSGKYTFTSIRTTVSREFVEKLWQRYVGVWNALMEKRIDLPVPANDRCYTYNTLCEVSDRCEAFARWSSGPQDEMAKLMGR